MKSLSTLIFSFLVLGASAQQQKLNNFLLDFSVPDMPAFKALGTDPTNILRPSDLQQFAVMMGAFRSDGTSVLPKSFSLEVAPWKLTKSKNWTIGGYRENGFHRFLYNSSISLGTVSTGNDNTARNVSVGFRSSFMSKKADILRDQSIDKMYDRQKEVLAVKDSVKEKWFADNHYDIALPTEDQEKQFDAYWEEYRNNNKTYTHIDELVKDYNAHNWNGTRFDFAIAWVGASPDSLVKNIHAENFLVWATAAIKPGRNNDHGQLLIGINFQQPRMLPGETKANTRFTGNIRYYEGDKNFKGFVEFQYKTEQLPKIETGLLNLGAELRIMQDFWLVISAGVDDVFKEGAGSKFVSSIDLRYSFNKSTD